MKKYGYREPEPSQLFETLKAASVALSATEPELHFRFQHYLMKHSSVNGLVNEQTVSDLYSMLLDNSRQYLDVQPAVPSAGAMQAKGREYPNSQKQPPGRNFSSEYLLLLWISGSLDEGLPTSIDSTYKQ